LYILPKGYTVWNKGKYGYHIHSEESKRKIGIAHRGMKHTQESLEKMRKNNYMNGRTGDKNPRWRGGIGKHALGYIRVIDKTNKDGRSLQHRLVMEKYLGRRLQPTEIVHHINEDRADNRIENLMLFANIIEHQNFHRSLVS
jgi:hypothetical protein